MLYKTYLAISAMNVNNRFTIFLGLMYITHTKGDSSLTVSPYTVEGFPASLQCTVSPLSGSVEFQRNSNFQGLCSVPNTPASCSTSVSQSGDTTYFNITSLNYTQHDGVWTCVNTLPDRNVTLIVYSPYGDSSITVTSQGDNASATCQMKCQYPINDDFTSVEIWKSDGKVLSVTSYTASDPSANDGCEAHEKNLVANFTLSSTDVCGNPVLYCKFNHNVLGTNNSISKSFTFQACPTVAQCDYNWHILIGWVIGILIIPIAGFIFFMFQKHSGGSDKKCDGKSNKCKILVGAVLGGGALLALIICIIIATQVCLSQLGDAIGIGIGVSFGVMFMCVIIIVIVYFTCMKEKPDFDDSKPTTDKSEETNGKNNQIAPEKKESKNKALDEVPKGRQLPSPRNDVEENKIRPPTKLPPLNHEENSTSSPKKKKKKRKSKENENEDKSE